MLSVTLETCTPIPQTKLPSLGVGVLAINGTLRQWVAKVACAHEPSRHRVGPTLGL